MDVQILSQIKEKTCKHIFKNNYKRYLFYKFAKKNMEHDKKEIAMPASALYTIHAWSARTCSHQANLHSNICFFSSSDNFFSPAIKGKRICLIHFYMMVIGLTMITRGKKSCTGKRSHQLCGFGLIILKRKFFIASAKLVKPSWLIIPARTYIICITYVLYYICIVLYCICIVFCIT